MTNLRKKIIYVSGKYSASTSEQIQENILTARSYAILIWEKGYTALCPHLNTLNFEEHSSLEYDDYIEGDLELISRCNGVFMLPDWIDSKGANIEREYATNIGLPVFYDLDVLEEYIWRE